MAKQLVIYLFIVVWLSSCDNKTQSGDPNTTGTSSNNNANDRLAKIVKPRHNGRHISGEKVDFLIRLSEEKTNAQMRLSLNDSLVEERKVTGQKVQVSWSTEAWKLGRNRLQYELIINGKKERRYVEIVLLADAAPQQGTFRRLADYPHDEKAYTQGLVWHNGFLYEGTGQYGSSSIRKVALQTGEVLKRAPLTRNYFGEGITLFNNQIIQLTWRAKKGFVYDVDNFEVIKRFDYPTEGWGITHNGKELIMSDGTHKLYFIDPVTFQRVKLLEVYHDKGPVNNLNELEYIEGKIWANIYQTNQIAIIDPQTGKVEHMVNFRGLMLEEEVNLSQDVFNGIAYDKKEKRIFVTGKNWSKLYEVSVELP